MRSRLGGQDASFGADPQTARRSPRDGSGAAADTARLVATMPFHRSLVVLLSCAASVVAQDRSANQKALLSLLPDEAVAVVVIDDPRLAVTELRAALGDVPPALREHFGFAAWAGLAAAWIAVDGDPASFAATVAGGGAVVAVLPAPNGPRLIALLRPNDLAATEAWFAKFVERTPRATYGELLVVGSHQDLVARMQRRFGEDGPVSRWADVDFGPPAPLRSAIDLASVRAAAGEQAKPFAEHDAGARFLLLPLLHAATTAEFATFSLAGGERLVLRASAAASARSGSCRDLFAPPTASGALALPAGGLSVLRLDRSVRALLAQPERFLAPAEVLAVQGFLSIADAIDGAHSSFVDDLLGGLEEPLALHVLPVTPPPDAGPSRLQLPGFAVVARVKDPAVHDVLGRMAQAFVLIANAERQQRGQAPFPLRTRSTEAGHGFVAEPLPWRGPGDPPIEQGLSPTLWFENGHVVLASTYDAAMAMVAATRAEERDARGGDLLVLRGPEWADAIAASRDVLETGRVLDEGETPAVAKRFFDVLLVVARSLREVALHVECDDARATLELSLDRVR